MKPIIIVFFRPCKQLFLSGMCLLLSVFTGCSNDKEDLPPAPVSYTALIYMIADNSMDSDVDYSISQLKAGARHSAGTAVVYVDRLNEAPRLFKITQAGEEVPLKSYAEDNSANIETLVEVIEETKKLVPSEKFGLVLWSHSMGWLPNGYSSGLRMTRGKAEQDFPRTRYIGPDFHSGDVPTSDNMIEVDELAESLPDHVAEYIWFDVCLMGCVEGLYAVRNKCNYLIASPTEVLAEADYDASGIPYAKVLPYMFGGAEELKQACRAYYNHYNGMKYDVLRSATITLVDAKQLDGLYDVVHGILGGHLSEVESMDTSGLQAYHTKDVPGVFFDLKDMVNRLKSTDDAILEAQLEKTVVYTEATVSFKNVAIDRNRYCGLSVYVPLRKWEKNAEYKYYFESLEWGRIYD
ncbi:clostripain-related cysteine peptidase [Bacteroides thetaiotaomicron]|uniref:clostripain-related cysteine peptidase n=1 Tax=Bacteroides thetaiotaomicron TaxID=818 RepID=UPI0039C34003